MCGIAGIMARNGRPADADTLDALCRALGHRGPDGRGTLLAGGVGLAHTRLAIIDLETGDQPLSAADGVTLIANGEIYNHLELRRELGEEAFRTRSDCEAALHLYRRDGIDFVRGLRGMYALAVHDPRRDRLVLARDPFGIKPLYYVETDDVFAFASEPQALRAAGLSHAGVDDLGRASLLQLRFATRSALAGVQRLAPGEVLVVEDGRVVDRARHPALPPGSPEPLGEEAALARLETVLEESVELHQRSDVPYGMFLSGGIDSSALLALMARLNDRPVLAFTAGFPGTGAHDERDQARTMARAVGAEHVEVPVTEQDFWTLMPEIARAVDDPVADYAILPTYVMAREAGRHVKVILSGEGGDELFAGYGRYRGAMRPWPLTRRMRGRGTFDRLDLLRRPLAKWRRDLEAAERKARRPEWTRLQRAQAVDIAHWLPDGLLLKLDRCLMAHGVEGRVPLLDPMVADFAFRLPDELKVRGGQGKWLLRRWLETALPQADPFARKRGFTVPVGEWIAARADVGALIARQPGVTEVFDPDAVRAFFASGKAREHGLAAWTLLFYALWHRCHVEGKRPQGDIFATLSS